MKDRSLSWAKHFSAAAPAARASEISRPLCSPSSRSPSKSPKTLWKDSPSTTKWPCQNFQTQLTSMARRMMKMRRIQPISPSIGATNTSKVTKAMTALVSWSPLPISPYIGHLTAPVSPRNSVQTSSSHPRSASKTQSSSRRHRLWAPITRQPIQQQQHHLSAIALNGRGFSP